MPRARFIVFYLGVSAMVLMQHVPVAGQNDRIIGYVTQGGGVNTTSLIIRRPTVRDGRVTSAGSHYSATGSWTETGSLNGTYTYTVSIKSDGGWSASTKKMTEKLVLLLNNYERGQKFNGTWEFSSSGTCPLDPWRFVVTCTGIQISVNGPGDPTALKAAAPYPLSAVGFLTPAESDVVTFAEVISPTTNQAYSNPKEVSVTVQVHDATTADKSGTLWVDVQPYGSGDFPTAETAKDYFSKSFPSTYLGYKLTTTFDLSGTSVNAWKVSARFARKTGGRRSEWVRFATAKSMSSPSAIRDIEGESLAKSASASGAVVVQPMQQFGPSWGGGAQLWWDASGPGAALTVYFEVPFTRAYVAELYMTRAPDFGDLEVTLSNLSPSLKFTGYSPSVMWSGPIQMGKFQLTAGTNKLVFKVTGKYASSKAYRVGFDKIRLYPS